MTDERTRRTRAWPSALVAAALAHALVAPAAAPGPAPAGAGGAGQAAIAAASAAPGPAPARLDESPAAPTLAPADLAPVLLPPEPPAPPALAPRALDEPPEGGRGRRALVPIDTRGARAPPRLS
ncbi:MAG TPA: hypothetical protein VKZ63_04645 [Kofleriaceae bacterium]|nr:hypothetical protein [Kofleriaceae bacterium]